MQYHGKRFLYNFLKQHGYSMPPMKYTQYSRYRGSEWLIRFYDSLGDDILGYDIYIELYANNKDGKIYVSTFEHDEESKSVEVLRQVYSNDICIYENDYISHTLSYLDDNGNWIVDDLRHYF